ncbi:MAG TPA: oxygenase MpaB family protein [Thermoanaerobaculia bacterium]|nr:oxygenase MpaB family protein [Thermoanaerobaculia bacterium]
MLHRKAIGATVARPLDEVFDWLTTPGTWPECFPATLGISAAEPMRPVRAGDLFTEQLRVNAWHGHFDWTVEVVERPHRCVITGVASGDLGAVRNGRIEFTLTGDRTTTTFTREMTYPVQGIAGHFDNLLGFGRAFDKNADVALQTVVSILENPYLHGPRPDLGDEALLHEADPLADAAVASLVGPNGDTTPLTTFIGGLYRGEPAPAGLPEPMQQFLAATAQRAPWACEPRLSAASDVFLDWGALSAAAHICASLPETYALPRIAKLLNLTRQLDKDPAHADRRLWFTVRMCVDILVENGLTPQGQGLVAVQRLRLIHAMVRMFVQRRLTTPHRLARLGSGSLWDGENGKPISQLELLYTLLTFSHVIVRSFDAWNVGLTPYERESYIHIWNVAGANLGIRPELLPRNAADAARIFDEIKSRYGGPSPHAKELGGALVDYWLSLMPIIARDDAKKMMQLMVTTLISPATASIDGLDQLPEFSRDALHRIKSFLRTQNRDFEDVFEDAPDARKAAAALASLLMRRASQPWQEQSGIFDIPDMLYQRWQKIAAATTQ